MSEQKVEVSVVFTAHAEKKEWLQRSVLSALKSIEPPTFDIRIVLDRALEETTVAAEDIAKIAKETFGKDIMISKVDFGDLGMSRNFGSEQSKGRYVSFMDADDLFGCLFLQKAYEYARKLREERKSSGLDQDAFVLHPADMIMFQADNFIHRSVGDDSSEFDAKDLCQFNMWPASSFAPRDTFIKNPYRKMDGYLAYEDLHFHSESYSNGVSHRVVPDTVYFVRLKRNQSSMAFRYVEKHGVVPKCDLFDRRDLPNATQEPVNGAEQSVSPEVHRQALFAHYELQEYQILLHKELPIRRYPRQRTFADQAALRDAIFPAKHVVMVKELIAGGAEKFAIDWATALKESGEDVVILETEPVTSPWLKKAEDRGIKVVRWQVVVQDLDITEAAFALRRALVQCDLDSVFVCNSTIGWGLLHENPRVLAKKVFAASFAPIPQGYGFSSCPAFHFKELSPNLVVVTDNDQHAKRLTGFNPAMQVEVIPAKCEYGGPSKRSRIEKDRLRILWAGRGTQEKRPDLLPSLAAAMESTADIHVWGDVKPMNAPENLKYRGPFNGFESIDGSYDCYLMTSMYEGCPNTAMEAAMADLPIVGPAVGALPLLASETYKKYDPLTVATLIQKALADPWTEDKKRLVKAWSEDFSPSVVKLVKK